MWAAAEADGAKRAFNWTSRERFPPTSTVRADLGERRRAQRFPGFADTEEVTGSDLSRQPVVFPAWDANLATLPHPSPDSRGRLATFPALRPRPTAGPSTAPR